VSPELKVRVHACASLQRESTPRRSRLLLRATGIQAPSTIPVDSVLDGTEDGGGISESSSRGLRTPGAIPPSKAVYINEGTPVSAQNPMVDPGAVDCILAVHDIE